MDLTQPNLRGNFYEIHKLNMRTMKLKYTLSIIVIRLQHLSYKKPKLQSLIHRRQI